MGLVLAVALLALALSLGTGGRVRLLAEQRLRGAAVLVLAVLLEVAAAALGASGTAWTVVSSAGTLLAAGAVLANRRTAGSLLLGAGLLLNAAVVVANGAMPVSTAAAARAGVPAAELRLAEDPAHEALDGRTRLPWLADRLPVAAPWRREVASPGDVLAAAGVAAWAWSATRPGRAPRRPAGSGGAPWPAARSERGRRRSAAPAP
ncbi:hypothetical protein EV189_2561 [Motilibacter rhizosphaerae]|uniref:Uncharacterized protein n=1 Tax=Motilibacter rhizosphaerae TaxID=598652 RepID=A0A4Q7NPZ2_9ACTN|nr:DUF5317 family protein [Motilibacter rhizosphaerae]RZS87138.1 hypothetical protein EV189_2561 [Motilibacter rhizosphaerae]